MAVPRAPGSALPLAWPSCPNPPSSSSSSTTTMIAPRTPERRKLSRQHRPNRRMGLKRRAESPSPDVPVRSLPRPATLPESEAPRVSRFRPGRRTESCARSRSRRHGSSRCPCSACRFGSWDTQGSFRPGWPPPAEESPGSRHIRTKARAWRKRPAQLSWGLDGNHGWRKSALETARATAATTAADRAGPPVS